MCEFWKMHSNHQIMIYYILHFGNEALTFLMMKQQNKYCLLVSGDGKINCTLDHIILPSATNLMSLLERGLGASSIPFGPL